VLQADGGTRTASICGAYVALADAIGKLPAELPGAIHVRSTAAARFSSDDPSPPDVPAKHDPKFYDPAHALVDELAAVSVGIVDGEIRLDLDYRDDCRAQVDMNVAYTAGGRFVELQGSAENGGGFDLDQMHRMTDLAVVGCRRLMQLIREARLTAVS
jgi:ribonuclease PH